MQHKPSLQKRLGLWLIASVILLWLVAVASASFIVRYEMNQVFDSALEETAQRILPLAIADILSRDSDTGPQRAPALQAHHEYLTYVVRQHNGELLLQSHDVDLRVFATLPRAGFYETSSHRFHGIAAVQGTIYIEVAEPLAHRQAAFLRITLSLLKPLLLLIPFSFIGVWWLTRRALRQVVQLQHLVEIRDAGDLSKVEVQALPEEFAPLIDTVNRLLARLRRALDAERSFTANSAHELRTPLAIALAKLQRLQLQLQDEPLKTQVQEIEHSLRRLSRLSEKLLELAKAEGGSTQSEQLNDLVPIIQMLARDYAYKAPGRMLLQLPEQAVKSHLDPDAFAILLRNLIENALCHGDPQQPVIIRLSADGQLRVINGGTVVPAEQLAVLRQRFVRSNSKSLGAGIGLAIVDAITSSAGIELHLYSPARGRCDGFEVSLNIIVVA